MQLRSLAMFGLLVVGPLSFLRGQSLAVPQAGFRAPTTSAATEPSVGPGFIESRTFWKEGGVLGGAATLFMGMLVYFEARKGQSPPSLALLAPAAAISFLVGAWPGAFLGGLIPKPARADSTESAEPKASLAWRPTSFMLRNPMATRARAVELPVRADGSHWRTGLWTGVILGAVTANVMVDRDASIGKRLGIAVAGATPLAVIGTLIGSAVPRR